MNLHHRHLFSLTCLVSPLIALLPGCSHGEATAYQGYVEGKFVFVASPQSGRLDHLSVKRGETIPANQPLFTLDPEPELSAESQGRQVLRSDERRLADLKTGKRPPEVDVIAAQLAQAKVEHQKSIDILKSDEAQYAAGGLSQTDLINARAAVASNAAVVSQYQSDLDVAALPTRNEQINAQAAAVAASRAALAQATWKLQQKQIASSQPGLVFDTLYQEGDWVSAGSPIIQMLPPANVEVRFFIPQTVVGSLKLGQAVSVHCDGCAANVPSTITFISNQAEYTPPVIYSNESRAKLVFMIIAKPAPENAALLHPGQPIAITFP
jgi:HlyD family secretion protein